jgi:hypothetical protein
MRLLVSGTTRTMRELAPHWPDHLGTLLTPDAGNGVESAISIGLPWAADNSCFKGLDANSFRKMIAKIAGAPRCLFLCVPDVVADSATTLDRFHKWKGEVASTALPVAFVGQDGIETRAIPWNEFDAWFIGGSTRFKLSQASADLAAEAKRRGKHVHMGRVNSPRRLRAAYQMGCDSVDGSSMSRFGDVHIARFARFVRSLEMQPTLMDADTSYG